MNHSRIPFRDLYQAKLALLKKYTSAISYTYFLHPDGCFWAGIHSCNSMTAMPANFHELDLSSVEIPGFHILKRMEELEDADTQVYLAAKSNEEGGSQFLVRFTELSQLTEEEVKTHLEKAQEISNFINSLDPDEKALFVPIVASGFISFDAGDGDNLPLVYVIMEYEENSCRLSDRFPDTNFAAALRHPACVLNILRQICRAIILLKDDGYFTPFLTISDILFVPTDEDLNWSAKVVICPSCLFPNHHANIHVANKSLQALWRIHPDLGHPRAQTEGSEVFTLGTIFYQILAGRLPYHRPEFMVVTEKELRPITTTPGKLESLLLDMLDQNIDKRPILLSIRHALEAPEALAEISQIISEQSLVPADQSEEFPQMDKRSLLKPRSLVILFRIVRLLHEIGLGHALAFLGLRRSTDGTTKLPIREIGERVAAALKDLGPIFIKFGQILSTRSDQFPDEFCKALASLQDENEPAIPFDQINNILLEAWNVNSLEEVCLQISEAPIAVASIGQVHRALLKGGQEVVIKVLKPGIEEIIDRDLALLRWIANRLDASFAMLRPFRIPELIDQFERSLRAELLFETERLNLLEMEHNLSSFPFVTIPTVFEALSSNKVLVMGFLKGGIPIDNKHALQKSGVDPRLIAGRILEVFLKMIFIDGVFHADPHPGNLFVMSGNKIGLIDFGMIGRIPPRRKFELLYVLLGIINNSPDRITHGFRLMGAIPPEQDTTLFEQEVAALLAQIQVLKSHGKGPIGVGIFLSRIIKIIQQHNFAIPADVYMVFKTMLIVESSVMGLVPDLDLLGVVEEKIKAIFVKKAEDSFEVEFRKLVQRYAATAMIDSFILYRKLGESLVKLNQPKASPEHEIANTAKKVARLLPGTVVIFGGVALALVSREGLGNISTIISHTALFVVGTGIVVSLIGLFKK